MEYFLLGIILGAVIVGNALTHRSLAKIQVQLPTNLALTNAPSNHLVAQEMLSPADQDKIMKDMIDEVNSALDAAGSIGLHGTKIRRICISHLGSEDRKSV